MIKKRVLVISDLHCGHYVGLTPPEWYESSPEAKRNKYLSIQRQCWNFFATSVKKLGKIDILIVNGDCIDGRAEKSGSTELMEVDRNEQCSMATKCIEYINAKNVVMTYGTGYHTGIEEDWESVIARNVGAKIGAHEWIEINGNIIDVKHHIGNSSTPYSEYTPVAKDQLHNSLWSIHDEQPRANIIIRSHVHKYRQISDGNFVAFTTPALQGMGSKFGSRRCSTRVDFGFLVIDFDEKGGFAWKPYLAKLEAQKAVAIKL